MSEHVRILAVLYIVFGALGVLAALVLLAIFGFGGIMAGFAAAHENPDAAVAVPIIGLVGTFLFGLVLLVSLPGLIAGLGLLRFRPWARILTIVLSALNLLHVPIGTALGVYGLWVLLNRETEPLFGLPPSTAVPPPLQT